MPQIEYFERHLPLQMCTGIVKYSAEQTDRQVGILTNTTLSVDRQPPGKMHTLYGLAYRDLLNHAKPQNLIIMCTCMLTLLTLAKLEEARGEYGWTEKPEEDGTTDQLEAGVLSLCSKPLTQTMESVTKITVQCK